MPVQFKFNELEPIQYKQLGLSRFKPAVCSSVTVVKQRKSPDPTSLYRRSTYPTMLCESTGVHRKTPYYTEKCNVTLRRCST